MSRPLQAKLLRFLEDGSFTRVGGNQELRVNVRLIAATNRDIIQAIRQNHFREDLFHRLNVVQFRPPPLRDRGDDILLLARHFLRHFSAATNKDLQTITPAAAEKLMAHHWPGNVRELRNVIERAVILAEGTALEPQHLPDFTVENRLRPPAVDEPLARTGGSLEEQLATYERQLLLAHLERNRRDLTRTAEDLHISVQTLRYKLQTLSIPAGLPAEPEAPAHGDRDP